MITRPMTVNEILEAVGSGTTLKVRVPLTLGELICLSLEDLNDLMDDRILPADTEDRIAPCLSEISYRAVSILDDRIQPNEFTGGIVLVEVTAEVEVLEV